MTLKMAFFYFLMFPIMTTFPFINDSYFMKIYPILDFKKKKNLKHTIKDLFILFAVGQLMWLYIVFIMYLDYFCD